MCVFVMVCNGFSSLMLQSPNGSQRSYFLQNKTVITALPAQFECGKKLFNVSMFFEIFKEIFPVSNTCANEAFILSCFHNEDLFQYRNTDNSSYLNYHCFLFSLLYFFLFYFSIRTTKVVRDTLFIRKKGLYYNSVANVLLWVDSRGVS